MQQKRGHNGFLIALMLAFFVFGVYSCMQGTLASAIMAHYDITTTEQGLLATFRYGGGLIMTLVIAFFGERFNKIRTITISLAVLSLGCLAVSLAATFTLMLVITLITGMGQTTLDSMGNATLPLLYPQRRNVLMPLLHSVHSTGSMLGPVLLPLLMDIRRPETFKTDFLLVGVLGMAVMALCAVTGVAAYREKGRQIQLKNAKKVHSLEIFHSAKAWVLLVCCFCQFIFVLAVNSWLKYHFEAYAGYSFEISGVVLTAFAGGQLAMRFLLPLFLRFLRPSTIFGCACIGSALFMALAIVLPGSSLAVITVLCAISGFFIGVQGITTFLIAGEYFPTRMATATAIPMFALNIAGITTPLVMGALAHQIGLLIPLLAVSGVLALGGAAALLGFKKSAAADRVTEGR